jgi:hypothetical protein
MAGSCDFPEDLPAKTKKAARSGGLVGYLAAML